MDVTTLVSDEVNLDLAQARWTVDGELEDHGDDWWSSTPSFEPPVATSPWSRLADVEPSRRLPVTPNTNTAKHSSDSQSQPVIRHSAPRGTENAVNGEARQDDPDVSS